VISVLVADDEALVRAGFRAILEAEGGFDVVAEATDGGEAVRLVSEHHPDVVLMDIRMPRLDGLEATRRIMYSSAPPRVLMLTTFGLDEYVYEALKAGASGFLLKDVPRDQLVSAVRTIAYGESLLAPAITRKLIEAYVAGPAPGSGTPAAFDALSEREVEVLQLVARGLSNAEIAGDLYLSEATVKTHVAHLLAKLGLRDRVQAVVAAYEFGLVRPGSGRRLGS
jgi:DNA-binding NarL/FixJ family response regulator